MSRSLHLKKSNTVLLTQSSDNNYIKAELFFCLPFPYSFLVPANNCCM
jgi:hypothetical protein